MPTINQLVRKRRKSKGTTSDSPALGKGYNSFKKQSTNVVHHKSGVYVHVLVQ